MSEILTDTESNELVRACRTQIGDELRSMTYFTPTDGQHLYLRDDLERGDKRGFVETERQGFEVQRVYDWSELGEYNFTLHDFANGYLVRVIAGNHGLYITTDELTMHQFEELTSAIKELLAELEA